MHGLEQFNAEWGDIIASRERVLCAIWDGGLTSGSQYTVAFTIKEDHETAGNPGHARMTAAAAAKWNKEKIHIVDMWSSGWFDFLDGGDEIVNAAEQITVYNFSWHSGGGQVLNRLLDQLAAHDTIVTCPTDRAYSWPEWAHVKSDPSNLLCSHAVKDGVFRGFWHKDIPAIGVIAGSASQSCAVLAGAACLMKLLRPDATHQQIIAALYAGADERTLQTNDGVRTIPWLNVYRAGKALLGDELPAPTPQPEPVAEEPEPEPVEPEPEEEVTMEIAENEFVRIYCNPDLVNGTSQSRGNRLEGLGNMLEDNAKKTLFWTEAIALGLEVKKPCKIDYIRTGNDWPTRDIADINGNPVPLTNFRRHRVDVTPPIVLTEEVRALDIVNNGAPLTQVEYIHFSAMDIQPEPDDSTSDEPNDEDVPVEEESVASLVLTEPDGRVRTFVEV